MNLRVFNALRKLANAGQPTPQQPAQPKQQVIPAANQYSLPDNWHLRQTSVAPNTAPTKQGSTTPAQKVDPRAALVGGGLVGYAAGSNPKIRQQLIELIKRRRGQQ